MKRATLEATDENILGLIREQEKNNDRNQEIIEFIEGLERIGENKFIRFTAEHSDVDAYKPSNKNAKVNYTVHVSGLENLPGNKERSLTYNIKTNGSVSPANGTAHAAGTTNVSANKNWRLKQNEPHALVNELKPEIIVRPITYSVISSAVCSAPRFLPWDNTIF